MTLQHFMETYAAKLVKAIGIHLGYVVLCVSIGFAVAMVLAILFSRAPKISKVVMPVLSVLQTIPGIVFIGILFLYLGMRPRTVIIALSIYAVFPVLKNAYAGIVGVEERYREAARGCGMNQWQILFQVELPLAMPAIFVGLRMSTIYLVSWTVLASMIGLGGLGDFIYTGVGINNNTLILIGAVPAALMAIGLGRLVDWIQRRLTPRGLLDTAGKGGS